jgi:hypothetical protein
MKQKKNYWIYCKDCSPYWIYCKDCDTYHTFEEVPCFIDPDIPQLPPLPEDEKSAPLWTPDMKGTAEGNLMAWVLAMHQEKQKRRRKADGRIDWGIMKHVFTGNLEDGR